MLEFLWRSIDVDFFSSLSARLREVGELQLFDDLYLCTNSEELKVLVGTVLSKLENEKEKAQLCRLLVLICRKYSSQDFLRLFDSFPELLELMLRYVGGQLQHWIRETPSFLLFLLFATKCWEADPERTLGLVKIEPFELQTREVFCIPLRWGEEFPSLIKFRNQYLLSMFGDLWTLKYYSRKINLLPLWELVPGWRRIVEQTLEERSEEFSEMVRQTVLTSVPPTEDGLEYWFTRLSSRAGWIGSLFVYSMRPENFFWCDKLGLKRFVTEEDPWKPLRIIHATHQQD